MKDFSLCTNCLVAASKRHGGQQGIDLRRFVRDSLRGKVEVKAKDTGEVKEVAFGARGNCLTKADLEAFLKALSDAKLSDPGAYKSAVKVVIERELSSGCQHCENLNSDLALKTVRVRSERKSQSTSEFDNKDTSKESSKSESSTKGYRIAHAQKSLSLSLKHMWCHGFLNFDPPVCVVDAIILEEARTLGGGRAKVAWTRLNSVEAYRNHLSICQKAAGNVDLALWELFTYKGDGIPSAISPAIVDAAKQNFLSTDAYAADPGASKNEAWEGAMRDVRRSAFGRNPTWGPDATTSVRKRVHTAHGDLLLGLYQQWEAGASRSVDDFVRDLEYLVDEMNGRFGKFFN